MLDSKALTKVQSVILIVIVVAAATVGVFGYVLLGSQNQSSETVKIGVFADLDAEGGSSIWKGIVLAAEQLNAEGGMLGKQVEVIGEDNDVESGENAERMNLALARLLSLHEVNFIIGIAGSEGFMIQDMIAQHERIFFEIGANQDAYTQRVLDDYDRYKYYFRLMPNTTSIFQGIPESLADLREQTGFNRVGYIGEESVWKGVMEGLDYVLPEVYGFDLVYKGDCL